MEVILLEKVQNLGKLGEKVRVRNGYARNYLIPRGKAAPATAANVAAFETRRAELERVEAETLAAAAARRDQISGKIFTISAKAGDEGKLFGSVGTADIADAISATGVAVERHEVRLPAGSLRHVGEHEVTLHLHPEVDAQVTISIVSE